MEEINILGEQCDRLRERIAEGKVLVVIGTGVSLAATEGNKLASWKGLIADGANRCKELDGRDTDANWKDIQLRLLESNRLDDLLGVAEQVSRRLGWAPEDSSCRGPWNQWLRETVGRLHPKKPELIKVIRDLNTPRSRP